MRPSNRLFNFYFLITKLLAPKQAQLSALINDTLIKQRALTGSAYTIYKSEIFQHVDYPKDRLNIPHESLITQFDECVIQTRELNKLRQRVHEYLSYMLCKYPTDRVWKFIPESVHSWLEASYKDKVSDDIPDWFNQLCAELLLLRIIYADN